MVNDLLDIAKIESGSTNFDPKTLDLSAFVRTVVDGLQPVTLDKGIRLEADLNGVIWSNIDTDKLNQALTNLIDNACKFSNAGGEVRVELKSEDGFAQICVSDTGCGICPDDLPHVFEKFYRGQGERKARGAGLGLAIVKHFVELHGGKIWVESVPRQGSRFYVAIPCLEPRTEED